MLCVFTLLFVVAAVIIPINQTTTWELGFDWANPQDAKTLVGINYAIFVLSIILLLVFVTLFIFSIYIRNKIKQGLTISSRLVFVFALSIILLIILQIALKNAAWFIVFGYLRPEELLRRYGNFLGFTIQLLFLLAAIGLLIPICVKACSCLKSNSLQAFATVEEISCESTAKKKSDVTFFCVASLILLAVFAFLFTNAVAGLPIINRLNWDLNNTSWFESIESILRRLLRIDYALFVFYGIVFFLFIALFVSSFQIKSKKQVARLSIILAGAVVLFIFVILVLNIFAFVEVRNFVGAELIGNSFYRFVIELIILIIGIGFSIVYLIKIRRCFSD